MRLSIVLVGFFLAGVLVSGATAIDDEIENMLTNPDFEAGTAGWAIQSMNDGAAGAISIDNKEDSPAGFGQVMFVQIDGVGNDAWEPEIHSPSFALEQEETYTYSFWAKTEEGETKVINPMFESNSPSWAGAAGMNVTLTDEWQEYHSTALWTAETRPDAVIHIGLNFPPTEENHMWIAHAKVYEGDYVEEEIEGLQPKAVTPVGSLATAWGKIRSR